MRTARDGIVSLRLALSAEGGALAKAVEGPPPSGGQLERAGPAQVAASGPRAAGAESSYELLLEMILEGSRLHYTEPLVVCPPDPDLALLLGDQLYALGLARLAALGDLDGVAELADVISLTAQASAGSDFALAAAIWEAGAVAIGWGLSAEHELAKALAREGNPGAREALLEAARTGLS